MTTEETADKLFENRQWLWDDVALPRRAQRSTVIIMEINDPPVQRELKGYGRNGTFNEIFNPKDKRGESIEYTSSYVYDLQRGTVRNYKAKDCPKVEWDNILAELDNALTTTTCTVIFEYVYLQSHVDQITDFLASIATDGKVNALGSVLMVLTSNMALFDPTLRKLCYCFAVPSANEAERLQIGSKLAEDLRSKLPTAAKQALEAGKITEEQFNDRVRLASALQMTPEFVTASRGLNSGQLQTALMLGVFKERSFRLQDITSVKIDMLKAQGLTYKEPYTPASHIGGYEYLLQEFEETIFKPLHDPERAARYGITPENGIILFGPPGTGKTKMVEYIATRAKLPVINFNASEFMSKYVGESEQKLRSIFRAINENAPVILFCDEIDALLPDRDAITMGDSGVTSRTTNQMLEELGNSKRQYIVIGATNYIRRMDKAAIRPGRFGIVFPVFLPDFVARGAIWNVHTQVVRKIPIGSDVDVKQIADATWMWNGAEIEQLAKDSAQIAFRNNTEFVNMEQVLKAIGDTKVNLKAREANVEEVIRDLKNTQRYNESFLNLAIKSMQRGESGENASRIDALVNSID